jgi:hypothetical protein
VLQVHRKDSTWDGIIFSDLTAGRWTPGSSFRHRSRELDIPAEKSQPQTIVHLAITYGADNSITCYRNGTLLGKPFVPGGPASSLQHYPREESVVTIGGPNLGAAVEEVRIYNRALTPAEMAASFHSGPDGSRP